MTSEAATAPPVLWAQRKHEVYLTFSVECKDPCIKIEKDSVYFKGVGSPENREHEVTIPLYGEIIPDQSSTLNKGRCIELVLAKKDLGSPFWPFLTKGKEKHHWLKIDFNKWQDEDDSSDEAANLGNQGDFASMLSSMGGEGKGDGKSAFDDMESDSDDEELPDLE